MNEFIKSAINDRLRELGEEKESIDYSIIDLEKRVKELKEKQLYMAVTIKETLEFLDASKISAKAAKQAKNSKPRPERDGTPEGANSGNGEANPPARKATKVLRKTT